MKAPFPYFGGKSRVAPVVWERFGDVRNYVEPFFGSGAVLLSREVPVANETVNDLDGLLVNFWRAVKNDPQKVADLAFAPSGAIELAARHNFVSARREEVERLAADPYYYDAEIAAFWVYCRSAFLGARGIFYEKIGLRKPFCSAGGRGVFSDRAVDLCSYFEELASRLRGVRVLCGGWQRALTPAVFSAGSPSAVFLDPPYQADEWDTGVYACNGDVFGDVVSWAIEHGKDKNKRIALCGYDGLEMPADWEEYAWETGGGFGRIIKTGDARGNANAKRERIWFSPHCLSDNQARLF